MDLTKGKVKDEEHLNMLFDTISFGLMIFKMTIKFTVFRVLCHVKKCHNLITEKKIDAHSCASSELRP